MKMCNNHLKVFTAAVFAFLVIILSGCRKNEPVQIIISSQASMPVQIAGSELADYLGRIYPGHKFTVSSNKPESGSVIFLGTVNDIPELCPQATAGLPNENEGYTIQPVRKGKRVTGVCITGGSGRAVLYGVYGLLGKLGCGFYQSYETFPAQKKGKIDFTKWQLADAPLVKDRIILNWPNFVTGCSGWSRPEWIKWVHQSQKQGINTIMVHSYGNDPAFRFEFNGKIKPVGYWPNSIKGRGWGNTSVNDVRRLPSGNLVSDGPIFGSEYSMYPDEQRVEAAQRALHEVFTEAKNRGMQINYAIDVDTPSMLDAELVNMVPEKDRAGRIPLPDTQAGYAFWKAQVSSLLKSYPEITTITMWNRSSAFRSTKPSVFPAAWKTEFDALCEKIPDLKQLMMDSDTSAGHNAADGTSNSSKVVVERLNKGKEAMVWEHFALSKVMMAFRKALTEIGRDDVHLAFGSWYHNDFGWIQAAVMTMPAEVTVIPLDWAERQGQSMLMFEKKLQFMNKWAQGRVLPVIWNQLDDGAFLGRPVIMVPDFYERLRRFNAPGFGMIHWMVRPYDIFFKSHNRQVWKNSVNEPLAETAEKMAADWCGTVNRDLIGKYFRIWSLEAPCLGRGGGETMFYHGWKEGVYEAPKQIKLCKERLAILDSADISIMTAEQRKWLDYWKQFEKFFIDFLDTQDRMQQANALIVEGKYDEAKGILSSLDIKAVIDIYARMSMIHPDDIGERAMTLRLGIIWYGEYVCLSQMVGLEPLRITFGPTCVEPLAQGDTHYNDFFDLKGKLWRQYGENEFSDFKTIPSGGVKVSPDDISAVWHDVAQNGIILDKPIKNFSIRAINKKFHFNEGELRPGNYTLTVLLRRQTPGKTSVGASFQFSAKPGKDGKQLPTVKQSVVLPPDTGVIVRLSKLDIPVTLTDSGQAFLDLIPTTGEPPVICGFLMTLDSK